MKRFIQENFSMIWLVLFLSTVLLTGWLAVTGTLKNAKTDNKNKNDLSALLAMDKAVYPPNTIAVLNLMAPISYEDQGGYFSFKKNGALAWIEELKSVEENANVKAVIIRINSPGGTVAATQEVYQAVMRLKEKGKVVTVSMGDIAASGAYYISCAADKIVANPGSLVGSIGVIMAGFDASELMKKIGLGYNVIKSGENKDLLSSYKKMSDEEKKLLQTMVMDAYGQFFEAVQTGRKMNRDRLAAIADGRVMTGRQAKAAGLVDELGDFEQTVKITADLAKIEGKPNVENISQEPTGMLKYLTELFPAAAGSRGKSLIPALESPVPGNYSPVFYLYRN